MVMQMTANNWSTHVASVLSTEEKCDADGPGNPLHKLLNSSQIENIETSMHINEKKWKWHRVTHMVFQGRKSFQKCNFLPEGTHAI